MSKNVRKSVRNLKGRRTFSRLPARSVLLNTYGIQRSPPETRTPQHAPRASDSKSFTQTKNKNGHLTASVSIFGRGRRTFSRLPARSVLLNTYGIQRSPPETRTPQHAPRASDSKSFTQTKNKNGHLTASVSIFGRPSYAKYKYHLLSLGFFCNLDFCKLVMLSFMRKYGKFYNFIERNFCFKKIFTHTKII